MMLIVLTPLVWSLPIALMVAELTTLVPEEGGYYVWVSEALGVFWGVQEAWWTIAYSAVLLALFPVLFVGYLAFLFPGIAVRIGPPDSLIGGLARWVVALLVILTGMAVNLRGARDVGRSAKLGAAFVVGAFLLMVCLWLAGAEDRTVVTDVVRRDPTAERPGAWLLGLSIVVFNYSGWDNASTYAGEVDNPRRNYPIAIGGALVAVVLTYLLPVIAGVSVTTAPAVWSADQGWPVIAQLIGGHWLGVLLAAGGLVSMWVLFNAQLLYASRLPYVMARDGWLPRIFARTSAEGAAPGAAIAAFGAVTAAFAALSFGSLTVILCLLYTAAVLLEFLSLIVFRIRRPAEARTFRIPGEWVGLVLVCLTPFAVAAVVLYATLRDWRSYPSQLAVVGAIVMAGAALYWLGRARRAATTW
jgi:amino acid transporter